MGFVEPWLSCLCTNQIITKQFDLKYNSKKRSLLCADVYLYV